MSHSPSPDQKIRDREYDGEDQHGMYEIAGHVESPADQPKHDKSRNHKPEHKDVTQAPEWRLQDENGCGDGELHRVRSTSLRDKIAGGVRA